MPIVNALLVRYDGGYHEVVDQPSIDANGRKEGFLKLGAVQSEEAVETIAAALFERMAQAQIATTMAIEPSGTGDVPYLDFRKGDYITAPAAEGGTSSQRVRVLTTTEDENGKPIFVPELRTSVEEEADRLQRWLKRLANGALGGSTNSPSPSTGQSGTTELQPVRFAELPPFSFPGPVSTDVAGRYRPVVAARIVRWSIDLRVAGSSTTTVRLLLNGIVVDTLSLASGEQYLAEPFEADISTGTIVQIEISAAGTGAEDLLVQIVTGT